MDFCKDMMDFSELSKVTAVHDKKKQEPGPYPDIARPHDLSQWAVTVGVALKAAVTEQRLHVVAQYVRTLVVERSRRPVSAQYRNTSERKVRAT